MKKIQIIFLAFLLTTVGFVFNSCDDPEIPDGNSTELIFSDLIADKDTIDIGESIIFTATATGDEILYEWVASAGVLLGSGNEVTFSPSPCISGNITVTCTVKDKYLNSKNKELSVYVREIQ